MNWFTQWSIESGYLKERSMEKPFKLKTLNEIVVMADNPNVTELINYIDRLHSIIKDYQIVIDVAKQKDRNINQ